MVDNNAISENIRDMATVGGPVGFTIFGYPLAETLPTLYFVSVTLGILLMLVSGIYRVHKGKKDARAHELDVQERELRIQREKLEIARLQANG